MATLEHLDPKSVFMESLISFNYHDKNYSASFVVCEKGFPTYIYLTLLDETLAEKFGEEICLHSDGRQLLADHVYTEERLELYKLVFEVIQNTVQLGVNNQDSPGIHNTNQELS
ncbi:MAG: hypothetical protein K0Q66_562 [Chitinophagaceae bacterium]|jgi:hypothetical protein|nr:hypothetical protein [Chitinophagaceae bacterium]